MNDTTSHAAMPKQQNDAVRLWYQYSAEEVLQHFSTSRKGLSEVEAEKRRLEYGANDLPRAKAPGRLAVIAHQFKSPLVIILLFATAIAVFFALFLHEGDLTDAFVIGATVALNVVIGYLQEWKAQTALAALQKIVHTRTKVRRDGEVTEIDMTEVCPGEIIELAAGDKVPADTRLIEVNNLLVNEAPLTGESNTVEKNDRIITEERIVAERENMVFMGTVIAEGTAAGVVVETGARTEIGKIATLVSRGDSEKTPLQIRLGEFSKKLSWMVLVLAVIIFVFGLATRERGIETVIIMFETSIAIAVAAIPEGLVVAVTVILALGMQKILKQNALVRKLLAAETLGSTTVICTDKTGTLTEGEMQVSHVITENNTLDTFKGRDSDISMEAAEERFLLLRIALLCNDAFVVNPDAEFAEWEMRGNPTERALLAAALAIGLRPKTAEKESPRLDTIPFNSAQKYMVTLHQRSDEHVLYLKGAPERVLDFCKYRYAYAGKHEHKILTNKERERVTKNAEQLSRLGLRVLALGYRTVSKSFKKIADISDLESEFVFVGFVGIKDPLRPAAKDTIDECRSAGINVVMITGDHRLTARAIGHELGLPTDGHQVIEGKDLVAMNESELSHRVNDISVYARVSPEDKLRIVKAWQQKGAVVAMTGDGVNDAPALQLADIGIALGSGTEVAKEASDLVLLDNNFSTIVTAIREGRVIYDNIKKVVLYFLSDSFAEAFIIVVGMIAGLPLPLMVSQILFINILADGLPALSLTREPADPDIMRQKPQERNKPILDRERLKMIIIVSAFSGMVALGIFWMALREGRDVSYARTMVFTFMTMKTLLYIFSLRSLRRPLWRIRLWSNIYLLGAVGMGIILQVLAVYTPFAQRVFDTVPLAGRDWIEILVACGIIILMIEMVKYLSKIRTRQNAQSRKNMQQSVS